MPFRGERVMRRLKIRRVVIWRRRRPSRPLIRRVVSGRRRWGLEALPVVSRAVSRPSATLLSRLRQVMAKI